MRRRELIVLTGLVLVGCASALPPEPRLRLPELKLAPASLGVSVSLAQRLTVKQLPREAGVRAPTAERSLEVQLEVDASELRLAAFALSQRVLMLRWDGHDLQVQRHLMLPAEVDAARVLRDIQLVYWPLEAVQAALPSGWGVSDAEQRRTLSFEGEPQVVVDYAGLPRWQGRAELDNRLEGYRLSIESNVLSGS